MRSNNMASSSKLKIGLILDTSLDPNDGVQQYVVSVGEWLRSQGHDVHYLAGETKQRKLANVHSLARNVSVRFNGNRTTIPLPTSKRKLKSFIERERFDVLHVQTPHHPFMAQRLILAAGPETAVIATFHVLPYGRASELGNHLLGLWLRPSLRRIDHLVAVSPAAAEFERRSFHLDAEVVPNVINYQAFCKAKPLPEYDDQTLTILFLGRLVTRKGCQQLIQAVGLLKARSGLPKFRVLICGKGPLEAKLRELVHGQSLEDIVQFIGFVPEDTKARFYASADIGVFPSSGGESFGIVLVEAMASGQAAVLAGDNPGYRSVMAPQPDLLFDPLNVGALADKLEHFLTDDQLREQMAQWARDYSKQFDVAVVGPHLLDIYNKALHERRKK